MGEQQLISKLGEINGIIEHYCEHIMYLNDMLGEVTINKVIVTPRIVEIHKRRLEELKQERHEVEQKLIESLTVEA